MPHPMSKNSALLARLLLHALGSTKYEELIISTPKGYSDGSPDVQSVLARLQPTRANGCRATPVSGSMYSVLPSAHWKWLSTRASSSVWGRALRSHCSWSQHIPAISWSRGSRLPSKPCCRCGLRPSLSSTCPLAAQRCKIHVDTVMSEPYRMREQYSAPDPPPAS